MSSSFVTDTSEQKTDSSVVIVLNEDGSVCLDEQTLQKLFATNKTLQQPLSVIRMNQGGDGSHTSLAPVTQEDTIVSVEGQPEVNLTVEGFFSPSNVPPDATPSSADPLNAFMHMDPEQIEKLENALQSEQAKQILGVTMLDMLTSNDEKTEAPVKATSIQLDHCYTGSSNAGNAESEETESEEEEVVQRTRGRGKTRGQRGGKTIPGAGRAKATPPATRKVTKAQLAAPLPPPESKPPGNLTKLGQSPAKTMLRGAKTSPIKKEEKSPVLAERKIYPQRTNRKPPAHLADSYGTGLFSGAETVKRPSELVKKEPVSVKEEESEELCPLEIIRNNSTQALLEPEVIEELQAVLGDLGPEVLKPLEEAKAEMEEALLEEAEEEKQKQAVVARRKSSAGKVPMEEKGSPTKAGRPARKSSLGKVTSEAIKDIQAGSEEEEDDEDSEGDDEWDSEDDPDKLWCICRKPHNNRFMICCDKCEDWFHGHCVGITKAMGKQMEAQGKEWTCPKCKKLLQENETPPPVVVNEVVEKPSEESSPAKARRTSSTSSVSSSAVKKSPKPAVVVKSPDKSPTPKLTQKRPEAKKLAPLVIDSPKPVQPPAPAKKVSCIVCKKVARPSSIYCSDECILVHAQDSLNLLKNQKVLTPSTPKVEEPVKSESEPATPTSTAENRVLMYEQKTGKILAGNSAPTEATLKAWLKENPTYQVCKPNLVANIRQKLQDKTQIYIKSNTTPKAEPKTMSILGLPLKTPKQPLGTKSALLIPSQRLSQTGKPPGTPVKTIKIDSKGSIILPSVKNTVVKVVSKPGSTPLKAIAPKPPVKEVVVARSSTVEHVPKKQSSTEATRLSVRNSLQEVFKAKTEECKDVKVSENELKGLATTIEEELYALFKDVGSKYKAKFRSILFNVKDPKNLALFSKIVSGEHTPHQLVRLSSEDLASKELAEWREQEEKHAIDMIKKTEMDLMHQNVYIKTHKGEQIIEAHDSLKLQTDAVEAESSVEPTPDSSTAVEGEQPSMRPPSSSSSNSKSKSSSKDKDHHRHHHKSSSKSSSSSSSSRHHDSKKHSSSHKSSSHSSDKNSHSKDKDKERSKSKSDSHSKSSSSSSSSSSRRHSRHSSSDNKSKETEGGEKTSRSSSSLSKSSDHKEKLLPATEGLSEKEKEIMEKLAKSVSNSSAPVIVTEEETLSDREPSSTVNIKTPESIIEEPNPSIWKGIFSTLDATNFHVSISEVSGSAPTFGSDFPKICDIVGRISADTVWDYISKMKKVGSKEIMVVRFTPTSPEDKQNYNSYYSYLLTRKRFGVVGKKGSSIKDFYVMPLPCKAPVPQILLPFDGPGFEENRPNLLLGVIVQMHRKRPSTSSASAGPSKMPKSSKSEDRSYTPPLQGADSKSHTPPPRSYTPPMSSNTFEPYSPTRPSLKKGRASPEDDEPYSPTGGLNSPDETGNGPLTNTVASELEELNRQIEEEKMRIQTISSELVCSKGTSSLGEQLQVASFLSNISTDGMKTKSSGIPGLSGSSKGGMDKEDDDNEAYSPSRSFTPPPQDSSSIPFLRDTSTISLPSNLQEILASIQKKPATVAESSMMGLSLDCDPIVRDYADDEVEEPSTPPLDETTRAMMEIDEEEQIPLAAPEPPSKRRDPRQKAPPPVKEKQSSLSKLSEAELIAKANEMLLAQEAPMPPPPSMSYPPPTMRVPPPPMTLPDTRIPPPTIPPLPPMVVAPVSLPPAFADIPPPPPGTNEFNFKDQDMRQMEPERKGISFKMTKKPNLPRWDRKRQDDWDTDGSGSSYSKRPRGLSPQRSRSRDSD